MAGRATCDSLITQACAMRAKEARAVVECVMARQLDKELQHTPDETLAVRRSAAWWMTGDPDQYDQGSTAGELLPQLTHPRQSRGLIG